MLLERPADGLDPVARDRDIVVKERQDPRASRVDPGLAGVRDALACFENASDTAGVSTDELVDGLQGVVSGVVVNDEDFIRVGRRRLIENARQRATDA